MSHLPKGFKNNINVYPNATGLERRKELLKNITDNSTMLPKGVSEKDMDSAFIEFIKKDLEITLEGDKVPAIFLTLQKWSQFSQTWSVADEFKNIKIPFINIVRKPDIQQGTNQAGLWNIPGNKRYTYMKVPTWDGNIEGVDLYKIPQPTSVDLNYEVRMFSNKLKHLNELSNLIQRTFQSKQFYLNVNGHPMPVILESIGDESNITDIEQRVFYIQLFQFKLLGYLLNEDDFEVKPAINRSMIAVEVATPKYISDKITFTTNNTTLNNFIYSFVFKPSSEQVFTFTSKYNLTMLNIDGVQNISRITISINGSGKFDGLVFNTPIVINSNDTVTIRVYKNLNVTGQFNIIGNT